MNKYIELDECVENALKLFEKTPVPKVSLKYKRPLVIGSGNGAATGVLIFSDTDAVFADESNYSTKLAAAKVDGAVIVSASGEKHAPILAKALKKKNIHTTLLTTNEQASARKIVNVSYVFPHNPEPYTYNTSTYLGMILGKTHENPKKILSFIRSSIKPKIKNIKKYNAYILVVPNEFGNMAEMFRTKFDELFGPKIVGRIFTHEQMKHAKTVIPSEKELCILLGVKDDNPTIGKNKLKLPLPSKVNYGTMLCIGYWVIGQIQKQNTPWFKKNIEAYCKKASKIFGKKILPYS